MDPGCEANGIPCCELPLECGAALTSNVQELGGSVQAWETLFEADVRDLASETMLHVCGDSCYKYASATNKICRHGFYYCVALADWRRRRCGKPLKIRLFVVRETKFGMQAASYTFSSILLSV